MILDCVELLGLTQTCDFWGDSINYRNIQNYSARARFSGDPNLTGARPAWSNYSGLLNQTTGYIPIYVQGQFLGSGKITSLSTEGGIDVNYKPFSVNFQILKSGDLSQVTGTLYTGVPNIFQYLPHLNSFSEQLDYTENNSYTTEFTRNLNFDFEKGYVNQITGAHSISVGILSALAQLGAYTPAPPVHYTGVEGMTKSISQSLDTINGNFSYSESYSYQSGIPWVHEYQHSLQYGQEGITTVSEQGSIQANKRTQGSGERIEYALSGWNFVKTGIFPRVSGVFARWQGEFQQSGGCGLDIYPFQSNFTKDYPRGLVSYDYSYNNEPGSASGYYNSYEQSLTLNNEGWVDVQVNGELRSRQNNLSGALDFLYNSYTGQIRPQIPTYANNAYTGSISFFKSPFCSSQYTGSLALLNSDESYQDTPASISYDYNFSDDPSYISTGIFRKIKNTISNQEVTPLVNTFKIVNYLELPQNSFQSNLGVLTNNISIIGSNSASLNQYKAAASGRIVTPTGNYWMTSNTYEFNPFSYEFSMSVTYNYEGYRAINNYTL